MADPLKKKRRTRAGHRAFVTKTLGDIANSGENLKKEERPRLINLKSSFEEQYEAIKALDKEILDLLSDKEGVEDDEIVAEIEESGRLRADIKTAITSLDELLKRNELTESASTKEKETSQPTRVIRAKLPKLEVRKFGGKPEQWQEFWDGFQNSVHSNPNLSSIDKFSYLRGLVEEPAKTAIAGFALTSANYEAALGLLKRRFGKKENIQKAHINELMKVAPVPSARDTAKLRKLHDIVETHHRGLQALKVEPTTYSAIVVPAIVEKLPESVRLAITRGKKLSTEWSMEELLTELLTEVELREEHSYAPEKSKNDEKTDGNKKRSWHGPTTSNTFLTKAADDSCAFCRGKHEHHECKVVTSLDERKQLFRKYGRCFICIKKGHIAAKCNSNYTCTSCGGNHHRSICEGRADHLANSRNASLVSPAFHVGAETRVALQTAQAVLKGKSASTRVRVMFDSGSHRSFVKKRTAESVKLDVKRKEWIEISTFGQSLTDKGLRNIYELEIAPLRTGKVITIEAYEVPRISQIKNEHIEVMKTRYPHIQGLWFSDVCVNKEELEIEILIGSDYLWCFQEGRTIRGERDEPVAVETSLGWVLSGPMKCSEMQERKVNVSFVKHEVVKDEELLKDSVQRLWDLETLGIRETNEVHEALKDGIEFNGERYKVSLPWKEGHPDLVITGIA